MKLNKMVVLSLSASLLLVACGTTDTTDTEMTPTEPATEEPTDPAEGEDTGAEDTGAEDTGAEDTGSSDTGADTSGTSEQGVQNREFEISLDDAAQIFFDTFPDAEGIDHVEFDVDDGRFEYEIDGFNDTMEFQLTIDAETGDIYEQSEERDDDSEMAIDFDAIISPQEAMANALSEVGSGFVKEWDLETDDGRTIYEIDIEGVSSDLDDAYVDAITGEVRLDD